MKRILALFALLATVLLGPAPASAQQYLLKPNDVLQIEVLEDSTLNRQTFVLPDGRINFPLAGAIRAGGRTVAQVQAALVAALAPNFVAPPTVFVSLQQLAEDEPKTTVTVYVMGEVGTPGPRKVESGTRLLQFLTQVGPLGKFAATKRLQLRRTGRDGKEDLYTINYRALERGARLQQNFTMREGDVLIVPQRRLFE